jgi:hypothetical protein
MCCSRPILLLILILAVASPPRPVLTTAAAEEAGQECAWENEADSSSRTESVPSGMSALVLGGTGAVGEWGAVLFGDQAVVNCVVTSERGVCGGPLAFHNIELCTYCISSVIGLVLGLSTNCVETRKCGIGPHTTEEGSLLVRCINIRGMLLNAW